MAKELANKEKEVIFKSELAIIRDPKVRQFATLCIYAAPSYVFNDCPSSSSGKYHPLNEMGGDGVVIHTKKVVTTAVELSRGLDCEDSFDAIIAACIIHDLVKQGWKKTGHTLKNHPDLGAQLVEKVQAQTKILDDNTFNIIRNCVGYHYGPWSIGKWKKPLSNYSREELTVYLSDYVASKRCMEVDYRRSL